MGRVYLARPADDSPGLVAVKVIRPEYAEDPRFRRRFEREAAVHARLRTSHAPRLCGTGFEDELLWMATEYLPGFDLAEAVKAYGALETAAVWRLVAELGQALASLAVEEIVHRDLKPSNVLLSVRGAHVIDFGISKAADASAITGTGNRVGTPAYMSPEHLREGLSDTASDVFSLAGTLVYAATGRAPFGDGTGVDVMHRVAYEDPNPEVVGEIAEADAELGALLTACLDKEPARRPTPQELIDAAGSRPVPATWPEPLGGKVLARQQAYEALHHLPVEGISRLRSPGDLSLPPSVRVPEAAPPGSRSPEKDEGSAAAPPPGPPGPVDVPARSRKKALRVAVAALAICVVAVGAFLLIRQDPPAAASPKAGATRADGTGPRDASSGSVSPSTSGLTRPDVGGARGGDRPGRTRAPPARPRAARARARPPPTRTPTPGGGPPRRSPRPRAPSAARTTTRCLPVTLRPPRSPPRRPPTARPPGPTPRPGSRSVRTTPATDAPASATAANAYSRCSAS
ncbi:serine/threonine-protein kinase [Streptomyces canus]|uniref:serine/threonine-protein kinase n=1 Tax=Streptomyces canus TaxID=58343 RepID=UPI0033B49A0D